MIDAIVIGGSAGSFNVLKELLPALPEQLSIPVIVVVHVAAGTRSLIVEVFEPQCALRVKEAEDKETLVGGTVYFAPPGYHLLVERDGTLALSVDELVNYSRPAIDVLFQSASEAFGERLLAILLSGASSDGAEGLKQVNARGGTTVVQDPKTAEHGRMPSSAIEASPPTAVLNADEIVVFVRGRAR